MPNSLSLIIFLLFCNYFFICQSGFEWHFTQRVTYVSILVYFCQRKVLNVLWMYSPVRTCCYNREVFIFHHEHNIVQWRRPDSRFVVSLTLSPCISLNCSTIDHISWFSQTLLRTKDSGSRETGHFVRLYVATQICLGVERLCVRPNQCYVEFTLSCSVHSSNTEFDLITGDDVMSLCIEDGGRIQWKLFCLFVGF